MKSNVHKLIRKFCYRSWRKNWQNGYRHKGKLNNYLFNKGCSQQINSLAFNAKYSANIIRCFGTKKKVILLIVDCSWDTYLLSI